MNKTIEDYFYEIPDEFLKKVIVNRLPFKHEIAIINTNLCNVAYIDVSFFFSESNFPRDAFYTHIYSCDIEEAFKFGLDLSRRSNEI